MPSHLERRNKCCHLLRLYSATEMDEILEWSTGGMIMTGKTEVPEEKPGPFATLVFTATCTCTGWDWTRPPVMTALQYFMWGGNGGEPSRDMCTFFRCDPYQSRSRSLEKGHVTSTYSFSICSQDRRCCNLPDGFLWNLILGTLWKSTEKLQIWLKSHKKICPFTCRPKGVSCCCQRRM